MEKVHFTTAKTRDDIAAIIELQRLNQVKNIDPETARSQGFITFQYHVEGLFAMNQKFPSVVAWAEDGRLAGYNISASSTDRGHFPQLDGLFAVMDSLSFRGKKLEGEPMMLCGQICVAQGFRGQGVFEGLYGKFRELWSADFEFCLTEISTRNTRSLRAHERVGFEVFHEYFDPTTSERWAVVGWAWR